MKTYIAQVVINDRREKIVALNANKLFQQEHYIIECDGTTPFPVIAMQHLQILKALSINNNDINLNELQVDCHLQDNKLQVILRKKEIIAPTNIMEEAPASLSYEDLDKFKSQPKPKENNKISNKQLIPQSIGIFHDIIDLSLLQWTNGDFAIQGNIIKNYETLSNESFPYLNIELSLFLDQIEYSNAIKIDFAHKEQFVGIALDFGSESSQMAIKRYDQGAGLLDRKPSIENLFKNILAFHKSQNWIAKDDQHHYYQEEPNTNFYKSLFFLKEELSGDYQNIYKDLFIKNLPDNLKTLVNTKDGYTTLTTQKYHQIPNLKITHKYDELFSGINFNIEKDGYPINVSLGSIKNKVYNSILKMMIHSYLKKEFIISYNSSKKIRFILLVPNIYDYSDIQQTQSLLQEIFQSLADNEYQGKLLAWEIITISESDASFLGYINKNTANIQPNKDYIIIDSGKGTTDLSVIKTGIANIYNVKPVYRNGFAGAGNLISFAVFETLIHFLRSQATNKNAVQRFIKDSILHTLASNDLEQKNKFYQEIERLKFNYTTNTSYALQQWQHAKVGDITFKNISELGAGLADLTDLLKQIDCITDFYEYIGDTCNLIAQRTVGYIKLVQQNSKDFNCGGILFTGRSFMFAPLEQAIKQAISSQLNLPISLMHTLSGTELKDVCIKGVFNKSVRMNAEIIGYPIQYFTTPSINIDTPTPKSTENNLKSTAGSIQKRLLKLFFNELQEIEKGEIVIAGEQSLSPQHLYNSQILIGSKRYKITGTTAYNTDKDSHLELDIIYTPNGYIVRAKEHNTIKNIFELAEIFDSEDIEMNMVIPSLFPNYMQEQYIYSYKRSDDDFIINAEVTTATNQQNDNSPAISEFIHIEKPKGPIYF